MIYNLTILPHSRGHEYVIISGAEKLSQRIAGVGQTMIRLETAIAAARAFQREQRLVEHDQPGARPAFVPFTMRGRLTVRFPTDAEWEAHHEHMKAHADTYLYILNPDGIYPDVPAENTSLEDSMLRMLDAAKDDCGSVLFKIGPDEVGFHANSCVVRSAIGVPLLREGHVEFASKEIRLPHIEPAVFKVFLRYLYTRRIPDEDLRRFAIEMLALADQYHVPGLAFHTEHYLCWRIQAHPVSTDIVPVLIAAETFSAPTLKRACFATLFMHGNHLLNDPAFDALPGPPSGNLDH
jgi:hypothetical protein